MLTPFSLESWIAFRYLKTKKRDGLLSFITLVSIIGIALGIITLIVVLSVMNGFQKDIRSKLYDISAHMELGYYPDSLPPPNPGDLNSAWKELELIARKNSHVVATSPFIRDQVLLAFGGSVQGAQVLGIYPGREQKIINQKKLNLTALTQLHPGEFGLVLGQGLISELKAKIGDKITVISPEANAAAAGIIPRLKQFRLVGAVNSDIPEINNGYVYMHISDADVLLRKNGIVSGLRLKIDDPNQAPALAAHFLSPAEAQKIWLTDWSSNNRIYFEAVAMEKKTMFILMILISMVACFNLISSLVMTVNDKRTNIAILRTMGLAPGGIMRIFMLQGVFIGLVGTAAGLLSGLLLTLNLSRLVTLYEHWSGTTVISPQIYFLNQIPVDIQTGDLLFITLTSLTLSFLATLYPSYRAAKTQPVEALRYE